MVGVQVGVQTLCLHTKAQGTLRLRAQHRPGTHPPLAREPRGTQLRFNLCQLCNALLLLSLRASHQWHTHRLDHSVMDAAAGVGVGGVGQLCLLSRGEWGE